METIKRYPLFSKRIVVASIFMSLVFSCSKNNTYTYDANGNVATMVSYRE